MTTRGPQTGGDADHPSARTQGVETSRDHDGHDAAGKVHAELEFHPLAELLPMAGDDVLQEFISDIRRGLRPVVTLFEGKILDGRTAYGAYRQAGVVPPYEDYTGTDAAGLVISRNLHRRHMNESQRALVAARLANLEVGANQYTKPGLPIGTASKLLQVSPRSTARAREMLQQGIPQLVTAVASGHLPLSRAACLSRLSEQDQRCAVSRGFKIPHRVEVPQEARAADHSPRSESAEQSAQNSISEEKSDDATTCAVTYQVDSTAWLWNRYIPVPSVTALVGGAASAILEVAVKMATVVYTRGLWPDYGDSLQGNVVWLSTQRGIERFMRRRFEAAGATNGDIPVLEAAADNFNLAIRNLSADLYRLASKVQALGNVKLVVVDYPSEYFRNTEVADAIWTFRGVVDACHEFATRFGVAVLLPCQLFGERVAVTETVEALKSARKMHRTFILERGDQANMGLLQTGAEAFVFKLRHRDRVRFADWAITTNFDRIVVSDRLI